MQKGLILTLLLSSLLLAQRAYAEPSEEAKRAEMRKKVEAKKLDLNGTQWEITVNPQGGTKGNLAGGDTLKFQDGRFLSENFSKLGFQATNYTITIPEVGPAFWETMQSAEKGLVTFWRGEWDGDTMSGVISRQLPEGKNEDYYFTSSARVKIFPTSAEEEAEKEKDAGETSVSSAASSTPATTALVSGPKAEDLLEAESKAKTPAAPKVEPKMRTKAKPPKATPAKTTPVPSQKVASNGAKTAPKKEGGFLNYWLSNHNTNQQ